MGTSPVHAHAGQVGASPAGQAGDALAGQVGASPAGLAGQAMPEGRRWLLVAASTVSGVGHILAGHTWRGLLLFFAFAMAVNGVFIGAVLWEGRLPGERIAWVSALAGVAVWVAGVVDCYRLVILRHRPDRLARREKRFGEGVAHYLADDLGRAREAFLEVLHQDPDDVDALFYLGCVELGLDQPARARRVYKRLAQADELGKWSWELSRQLERVQGGA